MANRDIADAAENWMRTHGHVSHDTIDCSHFVTAVLQAAGYTSFRYMTADDFPRSRAFSPVDSPERGDIVHWPGHVGIVLDPVAGTFIGSQNSTGVDVANYKSNSYWRGRSHRTYLRYTP
ncbi:MAG: NlpC/P60 family protein [Minicystis sp.]